MRKGMWFCCAVHTKCTQMNFYCECTRIFFAQSIAAHENSVVHTKICGRKYRTHGITSWDLPPFPNWIYTPRKNETSGTKKQRNKKENYEMTENLTFYRNEFTAGLFSKFYIFLQFILWIKSNAGRETPVNSNLWTLDA